MFALSHRHCLKAATALAGGAWAANILLEQGQVFKQLNIAAVGCGGRGMGDLFEIASGNCLAALRDKAMLKRSCCHGWEPQPG